MKYAYGVTRTPGTRFMINSAATVALGWPTSFGLAEDRLNTYRFCDTRHTGIETVD